MHAQRKSACYLSHTFALSQVPRSKWDKEESEEEVQDEGVITVKTDALAVCLPSSSVCVTTEMPTKKETEREHEQQKGAGKGL